MRVLFIEIDSEREWAVASLGPAFIAAYLRRHGHEVHFLRATLDTTWRTVAESVRRIDPGLIGVSL